MKTLSTATRHWLSRSAVLTIAAAAVVLTLRGRLPAPGAIWTILRTADARWAASALLAQVLSQAAFAWQQRRLLRSAGVTVSARDALAITYSRSAISMALPAGSAMSAAFAVQQYRRRGATGTTAATVTLLSLLASFTGLLTVCAVAFGPSAVVTWWSSASYEAFAAAGVLLAALLMAVRARPHIATDGAQPHRATGGARPTTVVAQRQRAV
ncbi:lysylphosphatidylglycerol synthase domain-containing protein, partial [Actinoplanes palleronii]